MFLSSLKKRDADLLNITNGVRVWSQGEVPCDTWTRVATPFAVCMDVYGCGSMAAGQVVHQPSLVTPGV